MIFGILLLVGFLSLSCVLIKQCPVVVRIRLAYCGLGSSGRRTGRHRPGQVDSDPEVGKQLASSRSEPFVETLMVNVIVLLRVINAEGECTILSVAIHPSINQSINQSRDWLIISTIRQHPVNGSETIVTSTQLQLLMKPQQLRGRLLVRR
jgi:hypothetical protein